MTSVPENTSSASVPAVPVADAGEHVPQAVPKKRSRTKKTVANGETLNATASSVEGAAINNAENAAVGVKSEPGSSEVQPKKRGRPKKTDAAAATTKDATAVSSEDAKTAALGAQPEGELQAAQAEPKKRGRPRKTPEKGGSNTGEEAAPNAKQSEENAEEAEPKAKKKRTSKKKLAGSGTPAEAADAIKTAAVELEKPVAASEIADAPAKVEGNIAGKKPGKKPASGGDGGGKDGSELGREGAKEEHKPAPVSPTLGQPPVSATEGGKEACDGADNAEKKKRIRQKKRGGGNKKKEGDAQLETSVVDGGEKDGDGGKGDSAVKEGAPVVGGGSESSRKRRRQMQAEEKKKWGRKGKEEGAIIFRKADREVSARLSSERCREGYVCRIALTTKRGWDRCGHLSLHALALLECVTLRGRA